VNEPLGHDPRLRATLLRIGRLGRLLAGGALIPLVIGFFLNPVALAQAWLVGFSFWLELSLGGLALLMLQYQITGRWGFFSRRLLEAIALTLPLLAVLFIPVILSLHALYPWTDPELVAASRVLSAKAGYLNIPFFTIRATLYWAVWIALALRLRVWSRRLDQPRFAPAAAVRLARLSAGGLVLWFLTFSFAAVDWWMSLEPEWFSSIYSVILMMGQALIAAALVTFALIALRRRPPLAGLLDRPVLNDLGNVILAFTMLWTYMAYMQWLIIWNGNLPEDISWYVRRTRNGWQWFVAALFLLHFAAPFVVLLSRTAKRNARVLGGLALLLLAAHLASIWWLIRPAWGTRFHWLDPIIVIGIGGAWIWLAIRRYLAAPPLPLHDQRFSRLLHDRPPAPALADPSPAP